MNIQPPQNAKNFLSNWSTNIFRRSTLDSYSLLQAVNLGWCVRDVVNRFKTSEHAAKLVCVLRGKLDCRKESVLAVTIKCVNGCVTLLRKSVETVSAGAITLFWLHGHTANWSRTVSSNMLPSHHFLGCATALTRQCIITILGFKFRVRDGNCQIFPINSKPSFHWWRTS
jgi:hypothetical protein